MSLQDGLLYVLKYIRFQNKTCATIMDNVRSEAVSTAIKDVLKRYCTENAQEKMEQGGEVECVFLVKRTL